MGLIPTQAPDVEAWLIATFGSTFAGAPVRNLAPKQGAPYSLILIRADLQNQVTPISRYCRVAVLGWKVRADGTADLAGARSLCASYAAALEAAPRSGILLDAEIDAGPYRVADSESGIEYQFASVLLEIAV